MPEPKGSRMSSSDSDTAEVLPYASVFLDILGWGNRVLAYDRAPHVSGGISDVTALIAEPIKQRQRVATAIDSYNRGEHTGRAESFKHLPPQVTQELRDVAAILRRDPGVIDLTPMSVPPAISH